MRLAVTMAETYNRFGELIDPAEAYQQFMLGLYDTLAEAGDEGYSAEACRKLDEARLLFMKEFEQRHPGYGKGRAVWR